MAKIVDQHCIVAAAEGEVLLECGHVAVSLPPHVAHHAADELHKHAHVAAGHVRRGDDFSAERA